jgi:branched-chain amino acid transport system permease protein
VFQLGSLTDVPWHLSGEVVSMTLLGGLGMLLEPVVGAGATVALGNELADKVGPWVRVIMGAVFVVFVVFVVCVVCVLAFRRGLVGELLARFGGAKPAQSGH